MATITPPPNRPSLSESHRRVRHPLQRLRRTIRVYVALECVALVLFFLASWFWIGLLLDYGVFKLSALPFWKRPPIDWLEVWPSLFAVVRLLLAGGLTALVAYKAGVRLTREFKDSSLALLLEQRYPKLLGDRLITAVELADPKKAARYGYSRAMVEQTIHDAGERVAQVPVSEVFNWRRLVWHGVLVAGLIFGVYLLVAAGFWLTEGPAGFGRFHQVAGLWGERNLLTQDSYWPRRSYLELADFPDSGDLRVGRDVGTADLRVRAIKWVTADPQGRYGWRAMLWSDVTPALLDTDKVPELPVSWMVRGEYLGLFAASPESGLPFGMPYAALSLTSESSRPWTVDRVEQELARLELDRLVAIDDSLKGNVNLDLSALPASWGPDEIRTPEQVRDRIQRLELPKLRALKDVFNRLDTLTVDGRTNGGVRKLVVPDDILVMYWNKKAKTSSEMNMQRRGDNEFTVRLKDLTESVQFTVRGEDYYTPEHSITVVPPPQLVSFTCDQYKPAYIFYRVDGQAQAMAGKRQLFADLPLSVSTGQTNAIKVPAGSKLVLKGTADRELKTTPTIRPVGNAEGTSFRSEVRLVQDAEGKDTGFTVTIDDVRTKLEFAIEFSDRDNVVGTRRVEIDAAADEKPSVEVEVEGYVREIKDDTDYREYKGDKVMTVSAWLPFMGKVRDDHGLSRLDYVYTLTPVDVRQVSRSSDSVSVACALGQLATGPDGSYIALYYLKAPYQSAKNAPKGQDRREPVLQFQQTTQYPSSRSGVPITPREWEALVAGGNAGRDVTKSLRDTIKERLQVLKSLGVNKGQANERLELVLQKRLKELEDGLDPALLADEYALEPDAPQSEMPQAGIDLRNLFLKVESDRDVQPFYRLQLEVEAYDNDIETGPHKGTNKVRFTFLIVSEGELLKLVGREEEELYLELKKVLDELIANEAKLAQTNGDIANRPKDLKVFTAMALRMNEVEDALDKNLAGVVKVSEDFERILKELYANRVEAGTINQVKDDIVTPLTQIVNKDVKDAKETIDDFRKYLDDEKEKDLAAKTAKAAEKGEAARAQLRAVIEKLQNVLNSMQGVTDFNKVRSKLQVIKDKEDAQVLIMNDLYVKLVKSTLGDLQEDLKP